MNSGDETDCTDKEGGGSAESDALDEITAMVGTNMGPRRYMFVNLGDDRAQGAYSWSATAQRKPVELRPGRDGNGYVPEARGKRRKAIVQDLDGIFKMSPGDRRGPDKSSDVPSAAIHNLVEQARADGMTVAEACQQIRQEHPWSEATIRDHYYRERRLRGDGMA